MNTEKREFFVQALLKFRDTVVLIACLDSFRTQPDELLEQLSFFIPAQEGWGWACVETKNRLRSWWYQGNPLSTNAELDMLRRAMPRGISAGFSKYHVEPHEKLAGLFNG